MKITVTVPKTEITTRGREIARLSNRRNAGSWRRAPAGTWHCVEVAGARSPAGMTYTLTLRRFDLAEFAATLDPAARGEAERIAAERYQLADFSCLAGFEVTEAEKRKRPTEEPESKYGEPTSIIVTRVDQRAETRDESQSGADDGSA